MRLALSLAIFAFAVSGCSPTGERDPAAADTTSRAPETSTTVEIDGETRGVPPAPVSSDLAAAIATMPEAIRGQWRANDLGRDPMREDCSQTSQSNSNFGKVVTVDAGGYSLFEEGGRIIDVHRRSDTTIDATFDTTYADTPTRERKSFDLQTDGSLSVSNDDEVGRPYGTEYLRCP